MVEGCSSADLLRLIRSWPLPDALAEFQHHENLRYGAHHPAADTVPPSQRESSSSFGPSDQDRRALLAEIRECHVSNRAVPEPVGVLREILEPMKRKKPVSPGKSPGKRKAGGARRTTRSPATPASGPAKSPKAKRTPSGSASTPSGSASRAESAGNLKKIRKELRAQRRRSQIGGRSRTSERVSSVTKARLRGLNTSTVKFCNDGAAYPTSFRPGRSYMDDDDAVMDGSGARSLYSLFNMYETDQTVVRFMPKHTEVLLLSNGESVASKLRVGKDKECKVSVLKFKDAVVDEARAYAFKAYHTDMEITAGFPLFLESTTVEVIEWQTTEDAAGSMAPALANPHFASANWSGRFDTAYTKKRLVHVKVLNLGDPVAEDFLEYKEAVQGFREQAHDGVLPANYKDVLESHLQKLKGSKDDARVQNFIGPAGIFGIMRKKKVEKRFRLP